VRLCDDILKVFEQGKWPDPYSNPFRPRDLGLSANAYGSFADYCAPEDAKSGEWNKCICLKVAKTNRAGRPTHYLLLPRDQWRDC